MRWRGQPAGIASFSSRFRPYPFFGQGWFALWEPVSPGLPWGAGYSPMVGSCLSQFSLSGCGFSFVFLPYAPVPVSRQGQAGAPQAGGWGEPEAERPGIIRRPPQGVSRRRRPVPPPEKAYIMEGRRPPEAGGMFNGWGVGFMGPIRHTIFSGIFSKTFPAKFFLE